MSSSSQTPVSSSQFRSILDAALSEYNRKTRNDLVKHWIYKELQSCDSAEAVLEVIQHQAETFDKFRDGNKRLFKWIGPSVHVFYTLSSTLGEGVGMPLPPAKAVFAGIGILLAAAKGVWASHDALVDLFERIQFFLKRLGVHTQISPTKDMVEILVKIVAEVLSILSIATKEMQQRRTKTYLKKLMGWTDIEDALERLDNLTREEFQMAMAEVRMTIARVLKSTNELKYDAKKAKEAMQDIAKNVDDMKDTLSEIRWDQIEQDVRRWLSPPDPSVNYNTAREAYQEGTASWIFEGSVFKEWELVGSLLWIHGKPGSGKSILCSAIIKHVISLRNAGQASLAYFFFDFRDKEKQNVRNFLTSLLTQFPAYSESCFNVIFRLYSTHGKGAHQPSISVLINCLKEVLKIVAEQPVYLIVDALDECPDDMSEKPTPRETVLSLVEDLAHMQLPSLHTCITSRPEIDIKEVLEPLAYCTISLHDESGQQKDILDYVRNDVYSDRKMRNWRDGEKQLVIKELSTKADGMFRWVFCQLKVLRYCLPSSIRQTLDQLPNSLDETYARVLSQIPEANQAHAHRLLQCLMVAIRPLRVEELAELLAFEFDTAEGVVPRYRVDWRPNDQVQALLSTCSSLIAIVDDHGSQVVQFSHFSVKEFLMSDRLTSSLGDFSRYRILPRPAHTIIAQACLGCLLHSSGFMDEERVKDIPLAEYAAQYWITHAQFEGVASRVRDGMESLFDCDKPYFATWVGIYNIDQPYQTLFSKIPTPLYLSSLCGFSDLVEQLANKHPQHVNAIGGRYEFPLRAALVGKHVKVAEILLKHMANVDVRGMGERTPLHEAIRDVSVVQFLLNHGADVNCRQDDLRTPLHLAASCGELEVARALLERGAKVDSRDIRGKTPLYLLFEHSERDDGILDLARLLLEHGADVNTRTTNTRTLLHVAALWGESKIARVLLEHKADVNSRDNEGKTPLHLLFKHSVRDSDNILDFARLLLENGADANIRTKNEWTFLHEAAFWGMPETARVLLEHKADVDSQDNEGKTPLYLLSERSTRGDNDTLDIARLLLDHGADVNIRTTNEWTLLHGAAFWGRLEIAGVLLDRGANANLKNKQGETPLHLVSRGEYGPQGHGVGVARLLLEHGVDVHAKDNDHGTALHSAAFRARLEITRVLLDHDANANAENEQGETALHLVSRGKYDSQERGVGVARLLLERGTDIDAHDEDQDTALHSAAFTGRLEITMALLDHGANANVKNKQGETPLHLVLRGKYDSQEHGVGIARLLLDRGGNVNAPDKDKNTPLHSASYLGRLKIARLLLDHGAKAGSEDDGAQTPLHLVSQGSYWFQDDGPDIAMLLLECGADMNAQDKDHMTPLHLACYRGRLDIARALLDYDARAMQRTTKIRSHYACSSEHDILDQGIDTNARYKELRPHHPLVRHDTMDGSVRAAGRSFVSESIRRVTRSWSRLSFGREKGLKK